MYGFKRRSIRSAEELEQQILELADKKRQQRLIPYIQQYEFEVSAAANNFSTKVVCCDFDE